MKKWVIFCLALLVILMAFSTCDQNDLDPSEDSPYLLFDNSRIYLDVQYIRAFWFRDINYPVVKVISSIIDLEQYFDSYLRIGNIQELKKYSDDFFENNSLIMVLIENTGGGLYQRLKKIDGNDIFILKKYFKGGGGAAVMSSEHIIIEIKNNYLLEQYQVKFIEK